MEMITTEIRAITFLRIACLWVTMILIISSMVAQQIDSRSGVILKNGSTELGKVLVYEKGDAGASFRLDGRQFSSADIRYFKSAHGYFANASEIDGDETYALRVRKGLISQYEKIKIQTYQADTLPNYGKLSDFANGEKMHYYHLQNGTLKKINYKNLKSDINSYIPSQLYLKDYKKFKFMQYGMLGVGLGLVAYSIISQGSNINFTPGIVLGTLLTGGSFGAIGSQRDALDNAIKAYNEKDKMQAKDVTP
jgi:hypothetical protein